MCDENRVNSYAKSSLFVLVFYFIRAWPGGVATSACSMNDLDGC